MRLFGRLFVVMVVAVAALAAAFAPVAWAGEEILISPELIPRGLQKANLLANPELPFEYARRLKLYSSRTRGGGYSFYFSHPLPEGVLTFTQCCLELRSNPAGDRFSGQAEIMWDIYKSPGPFVFRDQDGVEHRIPAMRVEATFKGSVPEGVNAVSALMYAMDRGRQELGGMFLFLWPTHVFVYQGFGPDDVDRPEDRVLVIRVSAPIALTRDPNWQPPLPPGPPTPPCPTGGCG